MGFLFPLIAFEFGAPDCLRLGPDEDIASEAFEFVEVSAVDEFIVLKGGGSEKEHGAKVKGWDKEVERGIITSPPCRFSSGEGVLPPIDILREEVEGGL